MKVNTPLRFSIFDLIKNDHDPDNDPLSVTVYSNAGRGAVSCSYRSTGALTRPTPT